MSNIKIPYLPYVSYNQIQADELWLNHTEAILMNYFAYFLPNFWEVSIQGNKNYYWLNYNKIFADMPTLDFSESTLRKYINKLINKKLLERIILTEEWKKSRAFYRATKNFLWKKKITPFNFDILYNNIEILLKEGRVYSDESDKLTNLLSSYKGSKKRKETTYNLDWVWWTFILDYLVEELKLSEKWEWVDINVWKEINKEYIQKNIVDVILDNWYNYWWIKKKQYGEWYDVNDEVKWKILGNLKKMFQWLKENNKTVKSWKWNINTWFWKQYI